MAGQLFVVSTPIGNLEDLTFRAARILRESAVVACEDTRVSRKLLDHHRIETPVTACHEHSEPEVLERLIGRLVAGEDVALITDAGTPMVSDPGHALVTRAIEAGVTVVPVPGPSAILAALAGAGLPAAHFVFLGFLPRSDAEQRETLAPWRDVPATLVIYEAPSRVPDTLEMLRLVLGDRPACVARELTKKFETFDRGTLAELAERYRDGARGEVVLVVGGRTQASEAPAIDAVRAEIERLLDSGTGASQAAKLIAGAHGLAKQDAYRRVIEVQQERSAGGVRK